ncbi:MAG: oxygen-independent coproporphyrinogen III oxidase [Betaproteobacteria bacterium]
MRSFSSELELDPDAIRRYDICGPAYTSYPGKDRFVEAFRESTYRHWLANRNVGAAARPLSLSVHIPDFANADGSPAWNGRTLRDRSRAARHVGYLAREISLTAEALEGERRVTQVFWDRNVTAFLSREEMRALCHPIGALFDLSEDCELAVAVDPRAADPGMLDFLREIGFSRVSIGVCESDAALWEESSIQSVKMTQQYIRGARATGFQSIQADLLYDLPRQTPAAFHSALDRILESDPDRIALSCPVCAPGEFGARLRLPQARRAAMDIKLQFLAPAIERLIQVGYVYIGMEQFAKPQDDLAIAQRQGRLRRDLRGYSSGPDCDVLGFGSAAISRIGSAYSRNHADMEHWHAALDRDTLPVGGGIVLSTDDVLRRAIIGVLMCQFLLSIESIEAAYLLDFRAYFAKELEELKELEGDGIVEITSAWIAVTPKGRPLVRVVCMIFDHYLREERRWVGYSKVL